MSSREKFLETIEEYNKILLMIDEGHGEVTEEIDKMLLCIDLKVVDSVDKYAYILDKLKLDIEYYKSKKEKYENAMRATKNTADRIKNFIKYSMQALEKTSLEGVEATFKLSKAKAIVKLDESKIETKYIEEKTIQTIDKAQIYTDLKSGEQVVGACLEDNFSLRQGIVKRK